MALVRGFNADKPAVLYLVILFLGFCQRSMCAPALVPLNLTGKTATHSSYFYGFSAGNAIDGNTSPVLDDGCSHTASEVHPWWKVDLGETHVIGTVTLINRDILSYRLANAVVRVGPSSDYTQNDICGSPVTSAQASISGGATILECNPGIGQSGRYVSVDNYMGSACSDCVLTLCEVLVEEYLNLTTTQQPATVPASIPPQYSFDDYKLAGSCVTHNGSPLSTVPGCSVMRCARKCHRTSNCSSFEYFKTAAECKLYAEHLAAATGPVNDSTCSVYTRKGKE